MAKKKKSRPVHVKVLAGEPTKSGRGRVCIHLFVADETGPFAEPHVLHPVVRDGGGGGNELEARPTRGRLACDPRRQVRPIVRNGVVHVVHRTDDPRAVTCPACLASDYWGVAMKTLGGR